MSQNITPASIAMAKKLLAGLPPPKIGRPLNRERPEECQKIINIMEENGITQVDIAKLTGMRGSNISAVLSGAIKMTPYNRYRIMAAINAIIYNE